MTESNEDNPGADGADGLSDDDIEAAFAGFEQDFGDFEDPAIAQMNEALKRNEEGAASSQGTSSQGTSSQDAQSLGAAPSQADASDGTPNGERQQGEPSDGTSAQSGEADDAFSDDDFDNDLADVSDMESALQQLLGEKASSAMLLTQVRDADVLAAFSVICGIDAYCIADKSGAIAVLKDLDGRHPEDAAQALTKLVNGMSVLLVVNRAGRIEAHQWVNATQGESFPPPIVFMNAPAFVEDVMVGQARAADVVSSGDFSVIDTQGLGKAKAFQILQDLADRANRRQHRRFGFGLRRRFRNDDAGSDQTDGTDEPGGPYASGTTDDGNPDDGTGPATTGE